MPHPAANPATLAVAATLRGTDAPPPRSARVLELGCGDAANLLSIASANPESVCVGIDASAAAIARGRDLAAAAGLANVDLRVTDIRALDMSERFEYVLMHGLWSWVSDDVREAALAVASAVLVPNGLALISYNALPGWWRWLAPRRLMLAAASGHSAPVAQKEAALHVLRLAAELHDADGSYGRALVEAAERVESRAPELLHHDDLAPECRPFALDEVARAAESHGLAYLDEALPSHWWEIRLGPRASELRSLAGPDPVHRQGIADLLSGVDFKATVFTRAGQARADALRSDAVLDAVAVAAHRGPTSGDPLLRHIADHGPRGIRVGETLDELDLDPQATADAVLCLAAADRLSLRANHPPAAVAAGSRPRASGLARAQAAAGSPVTTVLHDHVTLDDEGARSLVALLDGTRDRQALADGVSGVLAGADRGQVHEAVDSLLDDLAALGVLQA